ASLPGRDGVAKTAQPQQRGGTRSAAAATRSAARADSGAAQDAGQASERTVRAAARSDRRSAVARRTPGHRHGRARRRHLDDAAADPLATAPVPSPLAIPVGVLLLLALFWDPAWLDGASSQSPLPRFVVPRSARPLIAPSERWEDA